MQVDNLLFKVLVHKNRFDQHLANGFALDPEFEWRLGNFMQDLQTVNKNLFLTDFSEASETALAYARGLARHFGAQVYPAHACDPVILTETSSPDIAGKVEELTHLVRKNVLTGIPLLARGDVNAAVPRWVEEHGVDLIVMGTHGRHGLTHFLLGSVAEAVFRSATCPVLTVGPHVTTKPYRDFKVEKILVPTDLGFHASFAVQYALSLAQESRAQITLMHVMAEEDALQKGGAALADAAFGKLQKLVPEEAKQWCEPEFKLEAGDPVKELLSYAETERPDLIVLGLPAKKDFNLHFRIGVTYNLVASAPCPVLTVRNTANAG